MLDLGELSALLRVLLVDPRRGGWRRVLGEPGSRLKSEGMPQSFIDGLAVALFLKALGLVEHLAAHHLNVIRCCGVDEVLQGISCGKPSPGATVTAL